MSLDLGDLIDGLCNLLDIGPFKSRPHWPWWRRGMWFVFQILWWLMIAIVLIMIIDAWVN